MRYAKQVMLLHSRPESEKQLHVIDKTLAELAEEIERLHKSRLTPDEKWKLLRYKLSEYHELMNKLRKPLLRKAEREERILEELQEEEDEEEEEEAQRTQTPPGRRSKLKAEKKTPRSKREGSDTSSDEDVAYRPYNLRRRWQKV